MKTSQIIVLGVAVAAAGGAGLIAKNMTSAPKPTSVAVQKQPEKPALALKEVLVVSDNVPMGAPLDRNIMKWQAWPKDSLNEQFITRDEEGDAIDKLDGVVTRMAISQGEPVRKSRLIGFGRSFLSSVLPAGMRAVATQISVDTSAGGFILPNDYVDIIMTRRSNDASATGGFITETVLSNIRVLAIDQTIQEDPEGRKVRVGSTATLELTAEQAKIITVAQQMADRLTLALRSVKDIQEESRPDARYLVSEGEGNNGIVRVIKAGKITEEASKQ